MKEPFPRHRNGCFQNTSSDPAAGERLFQNESSVPAAGERLLQKKSSDPVPGERLFQKKQRFGGCWGIERRRVLRARKDSEGLIRRVHEIATKKGLTIPGIPLDGMLKDIDLSQRLEPFVTLLTLCLQLVEDTQAQADSEAWQAFLAYYSVLSTMASHDPEVAVAIAPVTTAMRHARKKPAPEPSTPEPAKP